MYAHVSHTFYPGDRKGRQDRDGIILLFTTLEKRKCVFVSLTLSFSACVCVDVKLDKPSIYSP